MVKCPVDGKRCYIKDPYKGVGICRRELKCKCRHYEFWEICPPLLKLVRSEIINHKS